MTGQMRCLHSPEGEYGNGRTEFSANTAQVLKTGFSTLRFPCPKFAPNTSMCNGIPIAPKIAHCAFCALTRGRKEECNNAEDTGCNRPSAAAPCTRFGLDAFRRFLLSFKNSLYVLFVRLDEILSRFTPSSCIPHFFGLLEPPFENIFAECK